MFEVAGSYTDLLTRLFPQAADGHLLFGMACSARPVAARGALTEWVEFRDYLMEGFVRYSLRAVPTQSGLRLAVRLAGTNRDQYVRPCVKSYIVWAGLSPVAVPEESEAEQTVAPDGAGRGGS